MANASSEQGYPVASDGVPEGARVHTPDGLTRGVILTTSRSPSSQGVNQYVLTASSGNGKSADLIDKISAPLATERVSRGQASRLTGEPLSARKTAAEKPLELESEPAERTNGGTHA